MAVTVTWLALEVVVTPTARNEELQELMVAARFIASLVVLEPVTTFPAVVLVQPFNFAIPHEKPTVVFPRVIVLPVTGTTFTVLVLGVAHMKNWGR